MRKNKKGKNHSFNMAIDYKKLTHGFSMDRRPRYNNTLLWKEALERDNYEIAIKHESL